MRNFTEPLYLMLVDDEPRLMPLRQAGVMYDSWWHRVEIGPYVVDPTNMKVRRVTAEDRAKISDLADEYSASK